MKYTSDIGIGRDGLELNGNNGWFLRSMLPYSSHTCLYNTSSVSILHGGIVCLKVAEPSSLLSDQRHVIVVFDIDFILYRPIYIYIYIYIVGVIYSVLFVRILKADFFSPCL